MKKLLIILAMFAVLMGAAIWEIVFTSRFFSETDQKLSVLYESLSQNEDRTDNPETLLLLSDLEQYWNKGKRTAMMLVTHTVIRNADERLVALGEFTRRNEHSDASVSLKQAQNYIRDLKEDNYPIWINLF